MVEIIFGICMLIIPYNHLQCPLESNLWVHFEYSSICLRILANNNNKYSYYKFINAKFEISIPVNILYPLEACFWVHFESLFICLRIFVNNNIKIHVGNL